MATGRDSKSGSSGKSPSSSSVKNSVKSSKGKASSNGNSRSSSTGNSSNGNQGNNGSSSDQEQQPIPVGPKPSLANGLIESTAAPNMAQAAKLLKAYGRRYNGPLGSLSGRAILPEQPLFRRYYIDAMMRDPEIYYGVQMLCGPIISKAKYKVISQDEEVSSFVERQIKRFWQRGLPISLQSAVTYGRVGLEVIYAYNEQFQSIEFKQFKYFHPNDTQPVIVDGFLKGMKIRNIPRRQDNGTTAVDHTPNGEMYLGLPKIFWAVHDQKYNRWYGRSRLEGAFIPWYEYWQPQGARNIRHGWFYKNCYDSGVIKHPPGSTPDENGNQIPNVMIAQQMLDLRETGAGVALENAMDGMPGWDYIPPAANKSPEGLQEYMYDLRDEKWQGLAVPPEVAKVEDTGSFAGRRVPQQAFYSFLQEIANEQMYDFDEQCLRYITKLNYGERAHYELEPVSIMETLMQEEMGGITGHLPGDETDPFYQGGQDMNVGGGRIEDRSSNSFNKAEQTFTKGAKGK